jgi:hypothetical protein
MSLRITVDGVGQPFGPKNGVRYTLEELQAAVGGCIEVLRLNSGELMVLNEFGKQHHLKVNQEATRLARVLDAIAPWDYIVGDVLVIGSRQMD